MTTRLMTAAMMVLAVGSAVNAQALQVGSNAPKLSVENWIRGTEVSGFEKGKVYVVEFWATWCGPCMKSIPHLSKLSDEMKDVTFIGVAASEKGETSEAKQQVLTTWLGKDSNPQITYTVAFDADRSMIADWMKPAGQNGIPCAFIVNKDSKIEWIGNPLSVAEFDGALAKARGGSDGYGKADPQDKPYALMVGDRAPELQIASWVKGDPITGFEKGKTYVVEFWATWCGPCIAGMPHLSELQKKYKDKGVTIVGVNIWDEAKNVKPFMDDKGGDEKMQYTVAIERMKEDKGLMAESWMKAAGRNGIPSAFIVNGEGKVAWVGHPMQMDKPLEQVVAGTWDLEKAAAEHLRVSQKEAEKQNAMNADKKIAELYNDGKYDDGFKLLQKVADTDVTAARELAQNYFMGAMDKKNFEAAYRLGNQVVEAEIGNDWTFLNLMAWTIVDPQARPAKQDLDLALKASLRANKISEDKNPAVLDTVAAVYWDKNDRTEALKWQEKAVKHSGGTQFEAELKGRLEEYKKAMNIR